MAYSARPDISQPLVLRGSQRRFTIASVMASAVGVAIAATLILAGSQLGQLFCPKTPSACDPTLFGWIAAVLYGWSLPITLAMLVFGHFHPSRDTLTLTSDGFTEVCGQRCQSFRWLEVSHFRLTRTAGRLSSGVGWDVVADPRDYKSSVYAEETLRSFYHTSRCDTVRLMNSWREAALAQEGERSRGT